jgi:hypothetical protein
LWPLDRYSTPQLVRRMRWAAYVARMGDKRNVYSSLIGKPERKLPAGIPISSWVVNINMDLVEIVLGGVDCIGGLVSIFKLFQFFLSFLFPSHRLVTQDHPRYFDTNLSAISYIPSIVSTSGTACCQLVCYILYLSLLCHLFLLIWTETMETPVFWNVTPCSSEEAPRIAQPSAPNYWSLEEWCLLGCYAVKTSNLWSLPCLSLRSWRQR